LLRCSRWFSGCCYGAPGGCQGVAKVLWVVVRVLLRCSGWLSGCC